MKAKITALNKNYLVEFKDDSEFLSFVTNFNDKINNVEIINEEKLPELEKPVEVAKPSMSDGWKTLEKSAFNNKEKGVEKKGMTLGGKYAEFKYEPDKNLTNSTDDKVSEPKNDSPALKGSEPKASDVEATAKENEVKNDSPKSEAPKADAPKAEEPKSEPAKEESKEEDSEKKTEKKEEVKESVELDESRPDKEDYLDMENSVTPEQKEEVREYFKDIVEDKEQYPDYEEMIQAMRSLDSDGAISHEQYNYCLAHWDEWLQEFDPELKEKEPTEEPEEIDEASEQIYTEDYKEGYLEGQDAYEMGHYVPAEESDVESDDFQKGYDDGFEDAKEGINKFDGKERYDDELEEVFKAAGVQLDEDWKDKARNLAAGAMIGAAVLHGGNALAANPASQSELTSNPAQIEQPAEKEIGTFKAKGGDGQMLDVKIKYEDGSYYDQYGNEWSEDDVESIKKGVIPAGTV